jgi:hypothetical protein
MRDQRLVARRGVDILHCWPIDNVRNKDQEQGLDCIVNRRWLDMRYIRHQAGHELAARVDGRHLSRLDYID